MSSFYKVVFFILALSAWNTMLGCDICGCAAGGNVISNLPSQDVNFVGVKYNQLSYIDPIEDFSNNAGEAIKNDRSHRSNLWFRHKLGSRWQLYAIFPYQVHERFYVDGGVDQINGLGDISTVFNYKMIASKDSTKGKWRHNLIAGIGVKLPTGKYRNRNRQRTLFPQNFQIGTGAFTFSPDIIYTLNSNDWGFNADLFYNYNTTNESLYKVGNQLSSGFYVYYWYRGDGYSLMPRLGGYFEWFDKDKEYDYTLKYSGGSLLYGTMGLDWYVGKFRVSGSYLVPTYYKFSSQTIPSTRFSVGVIYIFEHEDH